MIIGYSFYLEQEDGIYRYIFLLLQNILGWWICRIIWLHMVILWV